MQWWPLGVKNAGPGSRKYLKRIKNETFAFRIRLPLFKTDKGGFLIFLIQNSFCGLLWRATSPAKHEIHEVEMCSPVLSYADQKKCLY
jgi:hypothetical protein